MRKRIGGYFDGLRLALGAPGSRLMLVFALEGLLLQFATSIKSFGNNLFATNLGATDTQIGLIQTIGCAVTVILLLPVGIIADRCRSSKTVPIFLLISGGFMFILQGLVPYMGAIRLVMFYVFMGLSSGLFGAYNGNWQSMFGDLVDIRQRNRVYALRNRVMAALGVIVPVLCGVTVSNQVNSERKLGVLSIFLFISGGFMLIQALVVRRIPGGHLRTPQEMPERFSIKNVGEAIAAAVKNRPFMSFVLASMLIYTTWEFDWSMWYIGQTQYIGLSEAQLSYYSALCCIAQIFSLGYMAKLNYKKSVHFTACFCACALVMYPFNMIIGVALPAGIRPWTFTVMCVCANMFECGIGMCMVQMMLEVVPVKNRSLTISLYTILTTLSNAFMPLIGVQIYNALGGDLRAFRLFFVIEAVLRVSVAVFYVLRYRRMKRQGRIVYYQAGN